LNAHLSDARAEYDRLLADPDHIESILGKGAVRAREISVPFIAKIRDAVGIRRLGNG